MAVTTIPWGDGSGDNLYLTYPSASGDQTIEVSSDANTGSVDRSKVVTFSASANGQTVTKILTLIQAKTAEQYIVFADPVVEQICATKWGDGVGIKPSQAALVTDSQFGTTFRQNTNITSFDEFQYFTGITSLSNYAFQACTALESIVFPSSLTTIAAQVFRDCSSLSGTVVIPSSVTSIGNLTFAGCLSVENMTIESTGTFGSNFTGTGPTIALGDGTGTFHLKGSMTNNSSYVFNFRKIIIDGDFSNTANYAMRYLVANSATTFQAMKIGGNYSAAGTSALNCRPIQGNNSPNAAGQKYGFLEIMGTITSGYCILGADNYVSLADGFILHLGYDTVTNNALPCTPAIAGASFTRLAKIYVGKGQSAAEDNAILAKYTADADWSAYSSKLDTWYNYVNDPNANQDFIN